MIFREFDPVKYEEEFREQAKKMSKRELVDMKDQSLLRRMSYQELISIVFSWLVLTLALIFLPGETIAFFQTSENAKVVLGVGIPIGLLLIFQPATLFSGNPLEYEQGQIVKSIFRTVWAIIRLIVSIALIPVAHLLHFYHRKKIADKVIDEMLNKPK